MRTIIAGSRAIRTQSIVDQAIIEAGWPITEVVCGCALGVDTLGLRWALRNNVPIARFPADWQRYGRSAGHVRNHAMGDYAEALIAVWDGQSRGTAGMIAYANECGLRVYVKRV